MIIDLVFKQHPNDDSINMKTLKQKIIKTLLESDTSKDILDEGIMLRIQNNDCTQTKSSVNSKSSQPDILVEDMA